MKKQINALKFLKPNDVYYTNISASNKIKQRLDFNAY